VADVKTVMLSGTWAKDSSRLRAVTMMSCKLDPESSAGAAVLCAQAAPGSKADPHRANTPSKRARTPV
jgi:hypothetical protein